jgi:hypothetical protein
MKPTSAQEAEAQDLWGRGALESIPDLVVARDRLQTRLREAKALLSENIENDTGFEWRYRVETHLSATKESK